MEFNPGNDRPKKRIQDYLRDNVYPTISGDWSVPALLCTLQVMGTDRMLFSVDYPFENMDEAAEFLDNAPISEAKLAPKNACELFRLPTPYGALSTLRGGVNVRWGIEGDTFTMSWIESDGPHVSAPERRGFGTMVVEAMAEHSVAGTVDLDYAPSGVTWRLTCPAANALEPGNVS